METAINLLWLMLTIIFSLATYAAVKLWTKACRFLDLRIAEMESAEKARQGDYDWLHNVGDNAEETEPNTVAEATETLHREFVKKKK